MEPRRKHDRQFKIEAVRLVTAGGRLGGPPFMVGSRDRTRGSQRRFWSNSPGLLRESPKFSIFFMTVSVSPPIYN